MFIIPLRWGNRLFYECLFPEDYRKENQVFSDSCDIVPDKPKTGFICPSDDHILDSMGSASTPVKTSLKSSILRKILA
jgi:hypothetical protein